MLPLDAFDALIMCTQTLRGRLAVVHVRAHRLVPQMSLQLPPVEAERRERLELPRQLPPQPAPRLLDERVVLRT